MMRIKEFISGWTSKKAMLKWLGAAGMATAAILAMGIAAFAGTATKAPPFLPLNVHVGEKAPDFALPSTGGDTVKLSQFAGQNVLLDIYEGYW